MIKNRILKYCDGEYSVTVMTDNVELANERVAFWDVRKKSLSGQWIKVRRLETIQALKEIVFSAENITPYKFMGLR